ncbi:MAG TPA: C-GCAxxG-C-C family (seleno)protein [Candidatus Omnitrophota bacterium]|nr:C-GCAxxG-C-C family (seleno)protein [Candidatus Omnitrophota bacterium]
MSKEKALKHYTGREGHERLNCAQSVLAAFREKFGIGPDTLRAYLGHGGGNAPGGVCGAYAAARHILEKHHPGKLKELDELFVREAGSIKCDEIRRARKLSCLGCVEKAADLIAKL